MKRMGRVRGVQVPCDAIDWCIECDFNGVCLPQKSNLVYVVYGETYYQPFGSYPAIFGVFDTLDEAMKFREEKIEYMWQEERKNSFNKDITKEEIHVNVSVFTLNDPYVVNVGGYAE